MKKTLYLHIGHPKVASSTIQSALVQNIDALRTAGFLVADRQMQFPTSGPLDGAPVEYTADMCDKQEQGLQDAIAKLHELNAQLVAPFHSAVISAESLCIPQAEHLARALRHAFEIHVIYYIRRQDEWLISAWNQWGCQEGLGIAEYCERELQAPQPNFLKVLARWQPNADTVRVRPLHPSTLVGGDIVSDFFAAIGVEIEIQRSPPANTSLDLSILEVFSSSGFLFDSIHDKELADWLREVHPDAYPMEKASLGGQMLQRISDQFAEQNHELHQTFFADANFDEIFGARPQTSGTQQESNEQAAPKATIDRLRRVVGLQLQMLHDLNQRIARLEDRGDPN